MYDFDKIIDRSGSCCIKADCLKETFGRDDIIPMWVADMDWETPDFIVDALRKRLEHPVFGYPHTPDDYFTIIASWVKEVHNWEVDPEHIRYIPGIVKGISFAQRCFLKPEDKVIIQPPVYHPFRITSENLGHEILYNPLIPVYDEDGFLCDYRMDLEGLEKSIDERCKMLVLCNPHNPGGVCWNRETLINLAKICHRHEILVISDEIHSEIAFQPHVPFASVCEEAAMNSISFLAPSKTFNIAGIVSSYCIIKNEDIRRKFFKYLEDSELDYANIFSVVATQAAYTKGAQWRREMMDYLQGNFDFVEGYLKEYIPQIRSMRPQASFLMWLDCRKLGLSHEQLVDLFVNKARLGLNDGEMFGREGAGFMRLNVGCPEATVKEALDRLKEAVNNLQSE